MSSFAALSRCETGNIRRWEQKQGTVLNLGQEWREEMGTVRMIYAGLMRAEGDVAAGCA